MNRIKWMLTGAAGLQLLGLGAAAVPAAAAGPDEAAPVGIRIQSSPDAGMRTELIIRSPKLNKALRGRKLASAAGPLPATDAYVYAVPGGTGEQAQGAGAAYAVDAAGRWHDLASGEVWELPAGAAEPLQAYIAAARSAHYGELQPWQEAARSLTMKSICRVVDVETGLAFRAQRRAGREHADMQPVTKEDTAIMKQLYGGTWSWKRRAVLVQVGGHTLAASMHGMPHGGDGIPDNNFSGHFCIHFLGSITHGSGQVDPDHQWMVYKAAGRLAEAFAAAGPAEVANSLLVGVNQTDPELLKRAFADEQHPQLQYYLRELGRIKAMRRMGDLPAAPVESSQLETQVTLEVTLYAESRRAERQLLTFRLRRAAADQPWKIQELSLLS